jgi:TolA-binding protein
MHRIISLTVFLLLLFFNTSGQKTLIYKQPAAKFRDAKELFEKEKYASAKKMFQEVIDQISDEKSLICADATYYSALCSAELFNKDADYKLVNFINKYPENSKINQAWFKLGCYYYATAKYNDAIEAFTNVDLFDIDPLQKNEYYFKLGYSYFYSQKNDKAKKNFAEIKDINSKYTASANYYYAHILYLEGSYQTALVHFEKLTKDENFGSIVPYYIIQIYYLQGKYDELLKIAPELLKTSTPKRAPEIARLIGDSYYKTKKYDQAIPYFKIFMEKTNQKIERADEYQLAVCYYKTNNYDTAITLFNKVINIDDSLTQNSHYHLADCYLKTNQKKFARNSFLAAHKLNFDKNITEDALFQYAKLSAELSINPYDNAIEAFNKYIKDYPNSNKIDEANTYLVNIYMTTKNYKDALKSIESIKRKDNKLLEAYQRIAYNRGVELFNEGKTDEAVQLFKKVIDLDINDQLIALSHFWIGEALFKKSDYENALKSYRKFQVTKGAFSLEEYNLSNYNIGYVYFYQKNYTEALSNFKKFNLNSSKENIKIRNDAYLRTADCYFVTKDYQNAIENYNLALSLKQPDGDYALYQKAISQGVLGNFEGKISTLLSIINNYKQTTYKAATIFELANTYLIVDNNEKALKYFEEITENYPASSYAPESMLKTGLIHYNMHRNELAIQTLERVIEKYPGTNTAKNALVTMRNIYVETDRVDDFIEKVKKYPTANVTNEEQDSITYIAAENRYMEGDCQRAVSGFSNYINKFPLGAFLINSYFYKAECDYKSGNINEALSGYEYVINAPKSKFTEKSLLNSAEITYRQKKYEKALQYYQRLETTAEFNNNILLARVGIMRSSYNANKFDIAISASNQLLSTPKISNELSDEAHYTIAKSALNLDSISLAQTEFGILAKSKNGELSSEAKYNLAFIQYKLGNYQKAESIIYEYISAAPSSEYWLAKTLILWSDIYVKMGNYVQAKATLQSIIDKYDGPDLVKIANEKYNEILAIEKQKNEQNKKEKSVKDDEIKINIDKSNSLNDNTIDNNF